MPASSGENLSGTLQGASVTVTTLRNTPPTLSLTSPLSFKSVLTLRSQRFPLVEMDHYRLKEFIPSFARLHHLKN